MNNQSKQSNPTTPPMSAPRTETGVLAEALRLLSRDIQSEDGVANMAIAEAAERLMELQAENKALRKALRCVEDLISESRGVAGLHLNGDVATWGELEETWLAELYAALTAKREEVKS